ncbi:hypothetical protein BK731_00445, partial [Bacillus thuringiensis serovar muju]
TKFFISFVAFDVIVIGDLFYITPLSSNRQYVFIKNFIFLKPCLHTSSIRIYKQPIYYSMGCFPS